MRMTSSAESIKDPVALPLRVILSSNLTATSTDFPANQQTKTYARDLKTPKLQNCTNNI